MFQTCQVPQKPTGRRSYAPDASFEMFWDWQETLTQSFCDGPNDLMHRMDVWFCVTRGLGPREFHPEGGGGEAEAVTACAAAGRRSSS
jgi:hypothetical protein